MKRVFSLALQGLEAEIFLQLHLVLPEMGLVQHPSDHRQQMLRIAVAAFETDQQSVLVGVAAQPCPASFH